MKDIQKVFAKPEFIISVAITSVTLYFITPWLYSRVAGVTLGSNDGGVVAVIVGVVSILVGMAIATICMFLYEKMRKK